MSGWIEHTINVYIQRVRNGIPVNIAPGTLNGNTILDVRESITTAINATYGPRSTQLEFRILVNPDYYTVVVRYKPTSPPDIIPAIADRNTDDSLRRVRLTFERVESQEPISQAEISRGLSSVLPSSTSMPLPSAAAYGPHGRLGSMLGDILPPSTPMPLSSAGPASIRSESAEETKEEEQPEEIDYKGTVFDIFMTTETPMEEYLKEDPDNVVIIIERPGVQRRAIGYPRSQLREQYTNKSAIRYQCNSGVPHDALAIYATDVRMDQPYYRISVPEPYLIPMTFIIPLLNGTQRVWVLRPSGSPSIQRIASHLIVRRPDGRNLDGGPVNVVSAQHCQMGQTTEVMSLMPARLAATGGRRRRNRVTHRKKKYVRKHTSKRRK